MTVCERGDVILVPFPFSDQSTTKKRPALVISSNTFNRSSPDLIIEIQKEIDALYPDVEKDIIEFKQ